MKNLPEEAFPEKYRHDLIIIRETAEQIERDFNSDDFKIIFSGDPYLAFDELKKQLIPFIHQLLKKDNSAFRSLLYRIDIGENDYKKTLSEGQPTEINEKLAEIIIRREFQKVLTRKYFSDK